jgi:quercetin dioxygenase-like cupin family protein
MEKEIHMNQPGPGAAYAPIVRISLLSAEIDPARKIVSVEIHSVTMAPGVSAPLHLHPCPTMGVVTQGFIAYQIRGESVRHLKAGDAFYEPADVAVARFDNEGETPATFVVHYLMEEGAHDTVKVL